MGKAGIGMCGTIDGDQREPLKIRKVASAERGLGATAEDSGEREREVAVMPRGEPMSGREGEIA
jgi:hypothetical protein